MSRVRTFVAVELAQDVRGRTSRLIKKWSASGADVRWVKPENMHLTLNFLGDVDEREVHQVCDAVARAAASHEVFQCSFFGVGAFPNAAKPRTVWIGIDENREALCSLQAATEEALHKIGFPKERRRFNPHLTIGRAKHAGSDWGQLSEMIDQAGQFDGGTMKVAEVVVFSSQLESYGAVHHPLSRAPLSGSNASP